MNTLKRQKIKVMKEISMNHLEALEDMIKELQGRFNENTLT